DAVGAEAPRGGPAGGAAGPCRARARRRGCFRPAGAGPLKGLPAAPPRHPRERPRALCAHRQSAIEAAAGRYRLSLYLSSVLLLIMLVWLGLRLRAPALAIRRRAAFERAIAEYSTRLLNCPPSEIYTRPPHVIRGVRPAHV